ncbi:PspC domain-containing protein [Mucilaginibacter sp. UR6-11]|uniref:PspC domain-containing protein n=1 Tax=Mucilaginibacter sp. UR6-11 TaxID=1435644 RepID=UPI001E5A9A6A|nr:PspC domain-containing protein [Mucilaginibacter sp. UR6-11]MCC8424236.1 PspC domain-containing protein [Mucilaginibacter sp. UR6-11]
MEKKLQRDEHNKMIAGVCAGLADYLSIDVTLIRVLFVLTLVLHGCGLIPYIVLWIIMPKKAYGFSGANFNNPGPVDYTVPPQPNGPVDYTVPPQPNRPVDYSVPNQFGSFTPPQGEPVVMPPKKRSSAGIIVGAALVAFGAFFLMDNFNLLPDWDFDRLWPVIFIIGGLLLVFSPRKQKPWEKENWNTAGEPVTEAKTDDKTEDTPPAV